MGVNGLGIDLDAVEHVAQLARLHLSTEEKEELTSTLNDILDHMEDLRQLDLEEVPPMISVNEESKNVMTEDNKGEMLSSQEALRNAPAQQQGFFLVPAVLEEDESAH